MLTELILKQQSEIKIIHSFLKKSPKRVLDIGCGLGIYDLALEYYYKSDIDFYLLDKTTTTAEEKNVYYGYRDQGAFYNNMDYTKEFLELNNIKSSNIFLIPVKDNQVDTNAYLEDNLIDVDLVISIISWGFHYPISTYLDTVYNILSNDGILALHCRNIQENIPLLTTKFTILWPKPTDIIEGSLLICKKIV